MTTLVQGNPWRPKARGQSVPCDTGEVVPSWRPARGHLKYLPDGAYTKREYIAWYKTAILAARTDVNAFMEFAMTNDWDVESMDIPLKQQWFHEDMQGLLDEGCKGASENTYAAVALPRSHGKTTQMIGRILWELGNKPNLRIRILAETFDVAKLRVQEVKAHIERNKFLHMVFPWLKEADGDTWQKAQFTVQRDIISRDPTMLAGGILGGGTGGRVNLLIGDDVVGRRNALAHPKERSEVISAWNGAWLPQLIRGGRVWYFCTPWHPQDLSHKLIASREYSSYVVAVGSRNEAVWPELLGQKELNSREGLIGAAEHARAYKLEASDESDSPVESGSIVYVTEEDIPEEDLSYLLSVDLAVGKKSGDFFTVVVLGLDFKRKKIYVLDYYRSHDKAREQRKVVRDFAQIWGPRWVVVESVGYQESFADILSEEPLGPFAAEVRTFHPKESKRLRLDVVSPKIENAGVMFLDSLDPNGPDAKRDLVKQIVGLGIEPHDDLCDAFTQGCIFATESLHLFDEAETIRAWTV